MYHVYPIPFNILFEYYYVLKFKYYKIFIFEKLQVSKPHIQISTSFS